MIVFFGPAGSGKSLQGQILAAREDWRWLSAGQQLRDSGDESVLSAMKAGKLLDSEIVNKVMGDALARSKDISKVVLDGFPRLLDEAEWLISSQPEHGRSVSLVIVLDVPREELLKRLTLRGRADDNAAAIDERLAIYKQEIDPILEYFVSQNIKIIHIDGTGTVGKIHDDIMANLVELSVV